jgi:hypothetical protein
MADFVLDARHGSHTTTRCIIRGKVDLMSARPYNLVGNVTRRIPYLKTLEAGLNGFPECPTEDM